MKVLDLSKTNLHQSKAEPIYRSIGQKTRLSEAVFLQHEGISPHLHPHGEDCAIVLQGKMSYYVSNDDTIPVEPGELVFGWQHVLHGYLNEQAEPLQILLFVTPGSTGLAYPPDSDPSVKHIAVRERKVNCREKGVVIRSFYSTFETLAIQGEYVEGREEGVVKAFVDWERREVVVFDNEEVRLDYPEGRLLLKYTARS
jgi:quercetin dioxygenase-like cupin family protein